MFSLSENVSFPLSVMSERTTNPAPVRQCSRRLRFVAALGLLCGGVVKMATAQAPTKALGHPGAGRPAAIRFDMPAPGTRPPARPSAAQPAAAWNPNNEVRFTGYQAAVPSAPNEQALEPPFTPGLLPPPGSRGLVPRAAADTSRLVNIPSPLDLPNRPSTKSPLELPPPPGGETVQLPLPPARFQRRFDADSAT